MSTKFEANHEPQGQRGNTLIMALFLMVFVVGMVFSGSSILKSNRQRTETAFLLTGQASQFARSGLTEAINWFRRQPAQPVLAFAPQLDAVADPQVLDTEEPDIGLVREFRISGAIWGRYEVWKEWDSDPDADRLAWRKKMQVEDVSTKRGRLVVGSVWRVRCVAYVYRQRDANVGYRQLPNHVLASEMLETEITRMSIALPGQAAICARTGSDVSIKQNGRVGGGDAAAGLYYPSGSGTPTTTPGEVTGSPAFTSSSVYDDSLEYVFGVGAQGLRAMADNYLTNASDFPASLSDGEITVLDGKNINFNSSRPLNGRGIVIVSGGNVTIDPGSSTVFDGLLYIDGNLNVHAPAQIRGAVIVTGTVTVQGVGDFADVVYDDGVLGTIQQTTANYRMSRSARRRIVYD